MRTPSPDPFRTQCWKIGHAKPPLELDAEDGDEDGHIERNDDREDGANAAEDGNIEADEDVSGDGEDRADEGTDDLTEDNMF